ncbi:helix-turn-helix transcriptional regulator [Bradyrhizobium lablabi]|uniref:helix-turn-helix transcriptional regulator n=1 Tax=Bradyrhizobium lablabi TaxID=722472 RepID=UPI00090C4329|nr:helix-turn-helix domain-containing protein [Bradyrhizobium lablabi]SHL47404.1 hypothetical protein SAMN05444321_3014 [Bradyrhizobium lablabi]
MSNAEPILSQFLTKEELATELGRHVRTLDRWNVLGIGPPRTFVGRKILYRRMSVHRWLAAQESHGGGNVAASRDQASANCEVRYERDHRPVLIPQ